MRWPTPGSKQLYGALYRAVPEFRANLADGGPLLDVGSGIGGPLLTTLSSFGKPRAVGLELLPESAAELGRRARLAGVGRSSRHPGAVLPLLFS